ncbi:lipase family protein [Streptomyces decoyicus]
MAAFTQVATARGITGAAAEQAPEDRPGPPGAVVPSNAPLKQALAAALSARPSMPQPVVYVTGHSLGGCIATMLATYCPRPRAGTRPRARRPTKRPSPSTPRR